MKIIRTLLLIFLLLPICFIGPAKGSDDFHAMGLESFKAGDYEKAKKYLLKSGKQFPDNSIIAYNLGVVCYYLDDLFCSMENLDIAILSNQNFGKAFFARGVLKLKMDNTDQAKTDFKKSCKQGYKDGCTVYSNLY